MDTGIYVALSKETGIMRDLEVTANNIANMTTNGYEGEDLLFTSYLNQGTAQETNVAYANQATTYRDISQGTMQMTGGALDAAIEGSGYFVAQTPLGLRYTRNGNFAVGPSGYLVTSEGYPVLDQGGQPITFEETDKNVNIHSDGTITVDGSERATLKIAQFNKEQFLQHTGNSFYMSDIPPKAEASNFQVVAGMLERSNVQPFKSLTHMIYIERQISETNNFINTMYTLERNASNTLAKVYS